MLGQESGIGSIPFRGPHMSADLLDVLPIVICETAPVRDAAGQIVDLEWIAANKLMNESILPNGGSVVGMRIFEFDPAYRESEMVRQVMKVIETGEPTSFITQQGRAAKMLGKVMKTMIIPTERGALSCSHEVTDIAEERDEANRLYELARAACDHAVNGIVLTSMAGNIVYVNDALCEMSEWSREELLGKNVGILTGQDSYRPDPELAKQMARGDVLRHVSDAETPTKSGG